MYHRNEEKTLNAGKCIIIDEIQIREELFPALRSFVDTAKEKTPILILGVEFKSNTAPKLTQGFWNCCEDLEITKAFVVCPIEDNYPFKNGVNTCGIRQFIMELNSI